MTVTNCSGNSKGHCCYPDGVNPCMYLEVDTIEGRHWVCGLMRELLDWDRVLSDARYKENVAVFLEPVGLDCKTWPADNKCFACGANVSEEDTQMIARSGR